jgi:thioredoxin 1
MLDVTDSTFKQEVIESEVPVLVDFWAPWCGPCRTLTPILEEISIELNGKIKVVKVNIDDNRDTAAALQVRAIPTLALFNQGQLVDSRVGAQSKGKLTAFLETNITLN